MDDRQLGISYGVNALLFDLPVSCVVRRRLSLSGVYCSLVEFEAQM